MLLFGQQLWSEEYDPDRKVITFIPENSSLMVSKFAILAVWWGDSFRNAWFYALLVRVLFFYNLRKLWNVQGSNWKHYYFTTCNDKISFKRRWTWIWRYSHRYGWSQTAVASVRNQNFNTISTKGKVAIMSQKIFLRRVLKDFSKTSWKFEVQLVKLMCQQLVKKHSKLRIIGEVNPVEVTEDYLAGISQHVWNMSLSKLSRI